MIETPLKAQGGLAAPPPDPRLREPDPPPAPGSRYEHACVECGSPLHADQAACLNCGTMVDQGDGGAGIRRAALGSVTALLVLGGAVGAAVAGLPHGKHVPKPAATAQVFGPKKALPPATAGSNGTGSATTNPLPGGDTLSKPPPIAPVKPDKTKAGNKSSNKVTNSTGSSNNNTVSNSGNNNKSNKKKKGKKKKPKSLGLFADGLQPANAEEFTSSGSQGTSIEADHTTDNNAKTAWTATHGGVGIMVQPSSPPYKGLGIVSATPGYSVAVYYTGESDPPKDVSDWKPVGTTSSASKHERFPFDGNARNADHYLVWITGLSGAKVSINEIQLFQ